MQKSIEYSSDLQEALEHATRFAKLVRQVEAELPKNGWFAGRAAKEIASVNVTLAARNSGTIEQAEAIRRITRRLRDAHEESVRILGCDQLDCCTSEGCKIDDETESLAGADLFVPDAEEVIGVSHEEFEITIRKVWLDKPEVIARIRAEMPAVEAQAHAFKRKLGDSCPFEDLCAFAREGLLDAARTFDGGLGVPFAAWAARHMQRAIVDGLRTWGALPRKVIRKLKEYEAQLELEGGEANPDLAAAIEELKAYGPTSTDPAKLDVLVVNERATPEEIVAHEEECELLGEIIDDMTTRRRTVVQRHYFDGDELQDIAADFGHGKSWASKRHAKAIETIRAELNARNFRAPVGA